MALILPDNSDLQRALIEHNPRGILSQTQAKNQPTRPLKYGLLNLMPPGAFKATDRQWATPIAQASGALRIEFYRSTLPDLEERPEELKQYIAKEYLPLKDFLNSGLDALIITGANVKGADLTQQSFWNDLVDVFEFADDNIPLTITSCLSTHAYMKFKHNVDRKPLAEKCWGSYKHNATDPSHPLVLGLNSTFDLNHSRWNEITQADFERNKMNVLITSHEAGVALATSEDGRVINIQAHPEYDDESLFKEAKRDGVGKGANLILPAHYLGEKGEQLARAFNAEATKQNRPISIQEEKAIMNTVENTWKSTAFILFHNIVTTSHNITDYNHGQLLMDGVNPNNIYDTKPYTPANDVQEGAPLALAM